MKTSTPKQRFAALINAACVSIFFASAVASAAENIEGLMSAKNYARVDEIIRESNGSVLEVDALCIAAKQRSLSGVEHYLHRTSPETVLQCAASAENNSEVLDFLLESHIGINRIPHSGMYSRMTALDVAHSYNASSNVEYLVTHGAISNGEQPRSQPVALTRPPVSARSASVESQDDQSSGPQAVDGTPCLGIQNECNSSCDAGSSRGACILVCLAQSQLCIASAQRGVAPGMSDPASPTASRNPQPGGISGYYVCPDGRKTPTGTSCNPGGIPGPAKGTSPSGTGQGDPCGGANMLPDGRCEGMTRRWK